MPPPDIYADRDTDADRDTVTDRAEHPRAATLPSDTGPLATGSGRRHHQGMSRRRPPPRLVLASGSPRRADVLRQLGLDFEVDVPRIHERVRPGESPTETVERLAREKAQTAVRTGALALAADTMVALDDELLGKPSGRGEAEEMLRRLSGREHVVYTGMALASPERVESGVDDTVVRMRAATDRELADYAATREPLDKAGAYAIQGRGAALVAGIEGDYFNVMGFPLGTFRALLAAFGWRYAFGELAPAAGDEETIGEAEAADDEEEVAADHEEWEGAPDDGDGEGPPGP